MFASIRSLTPVFILALFAITVSLARNRIAETPPPGSQRGIRSTTYLSRHAASTATLRQTIRNKAMIATDMLQTSFVVGQKAKVCPA